jgi:hypothetical protein
MRLSRVTKVSNPPDEFPFFPFPPESNSSKILFVVYVLYYLEVGVFLVIYPWILSWEQNFLLYQFPFLKVLFLNFFFRGAVSGLGIANIVLGAWEVAHSYQHFKKA